MSTAQKPLPAPTAPRIAAILKRAGHVRAEYHRSGMLRGWGEWTRGFKCAYANGGRLLVMHKAPHLAPEGPRGEALTQYRRTIEDAGYAVLPHDESSFFVLPPAEAHP